MTEGLEAEIRESLEATTRGDWHVIDDDDAMCMQFVGVATTPLADPADPAGRGNFVAVCLSSSPPLLVAPDDQRWDENAAFIARSKEYVRELLAEVARLRAACEVTEFEVQQALGPVLYGEGEGGLPAWGEHTAATLATAAAREVGELRLALAAVATALGVDPRPDPCGGWAHVLERAAELAGRAANV